MKIVQFEVGGGMIFQDMKNNIFAQTSKIGMVDWNFCLFERYNLLIMLLIGRSFDNKT